jgi:predicted NAD/FAD-binding protein
MLRAMGSPTRRDVLAALAAATVLPVGRAAGAPPRRRVGIVGGGMAGVALAWLLDGHRDVELFEARPSLGGNIRSVEVDAGGRPAVIDMGAQYFHPAPYPAYTALLRLLGLYDPDGAGDGAAHRFAASITVFARGEPAPRFVSPALPGRWWPLIAPWNWPGLLAFAVAFGAAAAREQQDASWDLTLDEWLPTLGLAREQWEGILLPWAASLQSGDVEQARGMSARTAFVFAARALPPSPLDPATYFVLEPGMIEALARLAAECSTVRFHTRAPIAAITRRPRGGFQVRAQDGRTAVVDDLVLACSGPASAGLLDQLPGAAQQASALRDVQFFPARLVLHSEPVYAPADPAHRSFLNCEVAGGACESSMSMAAVLPGAPDVSLWKSWVSHRWRPAGRVLHDVEYQHVLPTPATFAAVDRLDALQGSGGLWCAGGYLTRYDSQEGAVRSALQVALGLQVASPRSQALWAALAGAPT